jgi:hypothetical protein
MYGGEIVAEYAEGAVDDEELGVAMTGGKAAGSPSHGARS